VETSDHVGFGGGNTCTFVSHTSWGIIFSGSLHYFGGWVCISPFWYQVIFAFFSYKLYNI
jgi:hypothetical protein